ncbi:hypothetical protein PROFUN_13419 [Planoprotostelium fungivorum]|uniref:Uncharacterized protein n=1 Tax=Planoprotostelium fungivorum TaxID=1890364 RepID=A0A2P6N3R5_9EUKA|nr:hypothetical protein PROFUN_13419 [Planoprotostelium fungivorum]
MFLRKYSTYGKIRRIGLKDYRNDCRAFRSRGASQSIIRATQYSIMCTPVESILYPRNSTDS